MTYNKRLGWFLSALLPAILSACNDGGVDRQEHFKEIQAWQLKRLDRLTSETGWLTLAGLFWLNDGENKCGSDSSNTVIFPPGKAPGVVGSLWRKKDSVYFAAKKGVEVLQGDSVVSHIQMLSDRDGTTNPTILRIGTLSFYVIERGGNPGVRVKDTQNPVRVRFTGLEYFPIDPKWRFRARFEPYNPRKILSFPTTAGTVDQYESPGKLVFEVDGKTHSIDAAAERGSENRLFIMFKDATNEHETYGGGRQLYTPLPDSNGIVILDFNMAYNWPCVFTDFATCPIPPRQNHLSFRVEAGEMMYEAPAKRSETM